MGMAHQLTTISGIALAAAIGSIRRVLILTIQISYFVTKDTSPLRILNNGVSHHCQKVVRQS